MREVGGAKNKCFGVKWARGPKRRRSDEEDEEEAGEGGGLYLMCVCLCGNQFMHGVSVCGGGMSARVCGAPVFFARGCVHFVGGGAQKKV